MGDCSTETHLLEVHTPPRRQQVRGVHQACAEAGVPVDILLTNVVPDTPGVCACIERVPALRNVTEKCQFDTLEL